MKFLKLCCLLLLIIFLVACSNNPISEQGDLVAVTVAPDNIGVPSRGAGATLTNDSTVLECESDTLIKPEDYEPTQGDYVLADDDGFTFYDQPFVVYGINYTPRDYPAERFLTQTNLRSIGAELDLMRAAGINVLRIPVRHRQLFVCSGQTVVPVPEVQERLDGVIHTAGERGFRLILVLNVDTTVDRYSPNDIVIDQIAYVAQRYHDEPAVMAYDIRQFGDRDYGDDLDAREIVLNWLANGTAAVRLNAPEQLVTAGWDAQAEITAPLVDFVSFYSDGELDNLRQEIAIVKEATTKPILLAHVGYDTHNLTEFEQRDALFRALEAVTQNHLAGWVIYTGFDHPLTTLCDETPCDLEAEARFGLWNTSYYPKRAVDALKLATGVITRSELESQ